MNRQKSKLTHYVYCDADYYIHDGSYILLLYDAVDLNCQIISRKGKKQKL